ncbi:ABC transporter permease [Microbacterium xanthum]|uniref:ABC transporter permease n=1 Tax=Microbacterium xanthum TaxID=3079794 RepID=UPI002AD1F9B8|nr:ABC transporter permease [Microbacterium sp. KSW-48]MDZ8171187.1 ABC transporter permease [Microbacterium sp. KSW-48]
MPAPAVTPSETTAILTAHPPRRTLPAWARRFVAPVAVAVVLLATLGWISVLELDSIEQRTLNADYIAARIGEHLVLSILASILVAVIAIPAGIAVSRSHSRVFRGAIVGLANIGQATPAIGVVILLAIMWQTGFTTALIALVIYAFLPVLQNTITGLAQVDPNIRESARGMGMTPGQVLRQVELPLASPVILAGLRTALVFAVGVATVATFINAGGLGDMIINGLKLQRYPVLVVGAVLVACIAVLIDWVAGVVEELLRPKGL